MEELLANAEEGSLTEVVLKGWDDSIHKFCRFPKKAEICIANKDRSPLLSERIIIRLCKIYKAIYWMETLPAKWTGEVHFQSECH